MTSDLNPWVETPAKVEAATTVETPAKVEAATGVKLVAEALASAGKGQHGGLLQFDALWRP